MKKIARTILIAAILGLMASIGQDVRARVEYIPFSQDLRAGSRSEDVKRLQQFLNSHNFPVAKSGLGSVGRETTFFGPSTQKALIRFQQNFAEEILKPLKLTQATGNFFSSTRNYINALLLNNTSESTIQQTAKPQNIPPPQKELYAIGGAITGINGPILLKNNLEFLEIQPGQSSNFQFPTKLMSGQGYQVTVGKKPTDQTCYFAPDRSAAGVVASNDILDIKIACTNSIMNPFTSVAGSGAPQYTVTPSGDGHETISPSAAQTVSHGNTQSFTITADAGYVLSPTVGGSCAGGTWSGSTYTTGAITASCSVNFSASLNTYTVTPSGDGHETISPSAEQNVTNGDTQTFTVIADSGFTLSTSVGGSCPSGSWSGSAYTTGAITGACTVTFSAIATPTVTGLFPNAGSYQGGARVAIQGTNFTSDATVKFGTTSAAVISTSPNSLTVIAPMHAVGYEDVTVTVSEVTSAVSSADQFTYGQQHLYVVGSDGGVYSCVPNASGAPTSCALASSTLLDGKTLVGVTVATFGSQQYAYVLVNAGATFQAWVCSISNSSPNFDSCQNAFSATYRMNSIAFATVNGTQYAYIAGQLTRGVGGILQKCSINSDKTLTCSTAYSGSAAWTTGARLTAITFQSVNNVPYVYLASNVSPGNIYYCPMLSNGNVDVINCHTSSVFPSSTTPAQMAFTTLDGTLYAYIAQTGASTVYTCTVSSSGEFGHCYSSSTPAAGAGLQLATFDDDSVMAYLETGTTFSYCTLNGPSSNYTLDSCTEGSGVSTTPVGGAIGFLAF